MSRLIKNPNKLVGDFHIKSSGDQNPIVKIENINDNNKSAQLHFKKTTASTAANDTIGSIRFLTTDSNDEDIQTASITSRTVGITEDSEAGSLILSVLTKESVDSDAPLTAMTIEGSTTTQSLVQTTINDKLIVDGKIIIEEASAHLLAGAGYGQIWVKDDAPNELCYSDDAGTAIQGIGKYHYTMKTVGCNYGTYLYAYLPMNGYIFEQTSTSSRNEYNAFIAPYNGTLEKFMWRTEELQDGECSFRILTSTAGTAVPGITLYRKEYTVDIADDTHHDVDMSSPVVGTDPPVLVKGNVYSFYHLFPNDPNDVNFTLVFKWDITS